jgi:hypothetical protein
VLGTEEPARRDPSKTSIVFATRHVPGALHAVLQELARRDINLTKIESRPRRNRPWHYLFYVDFEGHEDEPPVRDALLGILKRASFLKVLGSYPAAPYPICRPQPDGRTAVPATCRFYALPTKSPCESCDLSLMTSVCRLSYTVA